jgi:two-component system, NtrC family, sensor histidine kinase HydH
MERVKAGINAGRKREFFIFCSLSGLAFASLACLLAFFSRREEDRRRLELEYKAWQTSSAVMEYYQSDADLGAVLPFGISAFGIYDDSGRAVKRSQAAPASLRLESPSGEDIVVGQGSVRLTRRIGQPGMGMGMMGGRKGPDVQPRGRGRMPEPGGMPPDDPPLPMGGRQRVLYVEFPSGDYERQELVYRSAGIAVLLAIGGLYALIVWLYRRTLVLAERDERNRELVQLGEAARTIAHEIKNPLGVIRLQCVTLAKLLGEERKANIDIISQETERLTALTDKIGDFLRSQGGTPERVELVSWSRAFAARGGLGWSSEAKGECGVLIDPSRLESVIGNLASNAREASGGGTRGVEIRVAQEGGKVRLDLLDRGAGVPPELAQRIFDPFFTTKARGSGIGLSLARKFAQEAGGRLEFRRREGGGSQFSLFLPAVKADAQNTFPLPKRGFRVIVFPCP